MSLYHLECTDQSSGWTSFVRNGDAVQHGRLSYPSHPPETHRIKTWADQNIGSPLASHIPLPLLGHVSLPGHTIRSCPGRPVSQWSTSRPRWTSDLSLYTDGQHERSTRSIPSDVEDFSDRLYSCIADGHIFRFQEGDYFQLLHDMYSTEMDYLKTAYVATTPSSPGSGSKAPSEYLFGWRYGEIDRTLTGLNALRWIHLDDYDIYTRNQSPDTKLTRETFQKMRELFRRYTMPQQILTLITMQMTNDLGKSSKLQEMYYQILPSDRRREVNHDQMLYFVIRDRSNLVPSFQRLPPVERQLVQQLLRVSSEFNPAQLIQAECPPEAMSILLEQDWSAESMHEALDRKFLELMLDISGALGHVDHEGAKTMSQPVVSSLMHASEMAKFVAGSKISSQEAYHQILEHRLEILRKANWKKQLDIRSNHVDFAKARLLCMGRVSSAQKADIFDGVYDKLSVEVQRDLEWGMRIDHHIARQATYMPSMIAACKTADQLTATFGYLARVLLVSQSDLNILSRSSVGVHFENIIVVERDVLPIVKDLISDKMFSSHPSTLINHSTPLPRLQVLKTSLGRCGPLIGDDGIRQQMEDEPAGMTDSIC